MTLHEQHKHRLRELAGTKERFELLKRKLPFPYEWFDDLAKMDGPIPTDPKAFASVLKGTTHASEEDMATLNDLIRVFNLKTFRELHDLYLAVDVFGLADVFEEFRNICLRDYGLDPVSYVGLPGFAWDAMLKKTGVQLEQLSDGDMYQFCEKGIRGGISMAGMRHHVANNPALLPELPTHKRNAWFRKKQRLFHESLLTQEMDPEFDAWCRENGYDRTKTISHILYLDANNLYGWAMIQKLPVRNFQWRDPEQVDVLAYDTEGDTGCFVEVDLEYPDRLHDLHDMYPLAPEPMDITEDMVSQSSRDLASGQIGGRKLLLHLGPRRHYICHIRNLQFYVKHGMELRRVHRILEFHQEAWMKPWIEFNTAKRSKAANDFEKDFYKLMNNACFGKTMEDVRSRCKVSFVRDDVHFQRKVARPRYKQTMVLSSSLVACLQDQDFVHLNKPIYAGLAVLDLSKICMYQFHYEVMVPTFGCGNLQLGMTDTDSLLYDITCSMETYRQKLLEMADEHLDTSDYPNRADFGKKLRCAKTEKEKGRLQAEWSHFQAMSPGHENHPLYSTMHKKQVGKMKDEANGLPIRERVNLRAKCYAFEGMSDTKKKCKGVAKKRGQARPDPG